jgi:hypothetical protein
VVVFYSSGRKLTRKNIRQIKELIGRLENLAPQVRHKADLCQCYSLYLKCHPIPATKGPGVKGLVPSLVLLGDSVIFKR